MNRLVAFVFAAAALLATVLPAAGACGARCA
jgi:hypothetical protein